MQWNARGRPRKPATWSSFLPELPRSICSRVTPIGAINSGVSSTPCPNESNKVSEDLLAQKEIAGRDDTPRQRFRCGLRRSVRAEHEAFAGAFNCPPPARRGGGGDRCLQRDQEPAGR